METRRYLQGGLIIGVVWILAEASWLYFLTLISNPNPPPLKKKKANS